MGGLATAIDLSRLGFEVRLVERAAAPGGKMSEVEVGGASIDAGPTVLTMKWVFEELFDDAGCSLEDRVALRRSELLARHAWSAGEHFDLYADPRRTEDALGVFAGPGAIRGYREFREHARAVYQTLEHSFIRGQRPTPLGLVQSAGFGGLRNLWRIKPFETLWRELAKYFQDPRLQQLFARYATYCGSSPFLAPATLMLVAHVEMEGVWLVSGGMQRLAEALARLARDHGTSITYGSEAREVVVESGRATGVLLANGEHLEADAVVLNADAATIAAGRFGAAAASTVAVLAEKDRSLSALTFAIRAQTSGFQLARHTVFFCRDYQAEMRDLFERRRLPESPTVYVCAQDRGDLTGEPVGAERLFCIVNAPPSGDGERWSIEEIEQCAEQAFNLLHRAGLSLTRTPENTRITSPMELERRFPATGGALYGRATHGSTATFQRPKSRTKIRGLYLAGGSVHPGPGVPMAAISGRLAAASVSEDFPSTWAWPRAVTSGGTSTRSATMDAKRSR